MIINQVRHYVFLFTADWRKICLKTVVELQPVQICDNRRQKMQRLEASVRVHLAGIHATNIEALEYKELLSHPI
jgi:hypothetical protein